ncbi:MAG: hypothetical protein MK132_19185 [Lentisphaerales bacterium]|nr:hypothetical protein [Lentisphaerales bacterium]
MDLIVHDQKTSIELRDNNHQQLTLEILSWCPNFQSSWSDRKVQRVEHCLNKFFEALIKKAVHEFDRDLTKKKKEEKKEIDRQKIRDLEKENYLTQTGKLDLNAEQELAWAHEQANILDPLNSACSTSEEDSRQKVKALEADILKIKEPYKCFFRGYDI